MKPYYCHFARYAACSTITAQSPLSLKEGLILIVSKNEALNKRIGLK